MLTAEEFYKLRDDRTNRCVISPAYQQGAVTITLGNDVLATRAGRVLLQVTGNVLARWCRTVTIITNDATDDDAIDEVLAGMRDADPFGNFTATNRGTPGPGVHLHLGHACPVFKPQTVVVDAGGWTAWLGSTDGPMLPVDENILGAVAAACLGVAQAFRIASDPSGPRLRSGVFDLFTLSWTDSATVLPLPEQFLLGRLLLVGAGSVGSAVAYILDLAGASADVTVVDRDTVGIENLNRSPLFGIQAVRLPKVTALVRALEHPRMRLTAVESWWDEFASTNDTNDFDIWLPLANERGVRWSMQHNAPPLMIHASTGINGGVNFGRHLPGRGDCLVERFPEASGAPLACATSTVNTPAGAIDAAVPFASVFAGLLVVADLARLLMPCYPQVPNLAVLDFGSDLSTPLLIDRRAHPGCFCQDHGEIARRIRSKTRYAHYF